jgi:transposase
VADAGSPQLVLPATAGILPGLPFAREDGMAGRTLMILDVRELLRRLRAGQTDRATARDLGLARKTVTRYRQVALEQVWLDGPLPEPAILQGVMTQIAPPCPLPKQIHKAAPYKDVITKLREQGVEMKAIYQRLTDDHGYEGSYSALWRFVRQLEPVLPTAFVRLETDPGQEAQVDFTGAGMKLDPQTGKLRKAWCFVMTLSCSRHQYATIVFDQKVGTWLRCHRQAFVWFGGVPQRIVIDNLKAAIIRAALIDPVVQRSYREFAEHYGFLISPCRPRTPEHKGKVESGCHYVARNFLAGRPEETITVANKELDRWVMEVAGVRCHGTTRHRPLDLFHQSEQAALLPLPATTYDLGVWRKCKLHPDCHVVVEGAYYSAPFRLVGQTLWVRDNGVTVQIFHDHLRLATHDWGRPGTRRTIADHYPPDKAAYLMATPRFCRDKAERIGPACASLVGQLLNERPLDRLRAVQSALRLADKFGDLRLERACARSLYFGETSPKALRRILDYSLENEPLPVLSQPEPQMSFAFARPGSEIFLNHGGHGHG